MLCRDVATSPKVTPPCGLYCPQSGENLPFPCSFASHHCKIWHCNPAEEEEGVGSAYNPAPVRKNGFHLDSKEPDWSKLLTAFNLGTRCSQPQHRDFIMGEVRYNSLMKTFPQEAEELFVATERNAKLRYEGYKKLCEI